MSATQTHFSADINGDSEGEEKEIRNGRDDEGRKAKFNLSNVPLMYK